MILTTAERNKLDKKHHGKLIQAPPCKCSITFFKTLNLTYSLVSDDQFLKVFIKGGTWQNKM